MASIEKSDTRKADEIYSDILKQISVGTWSVGEQLPTERAFAEQFKVSRPTMSRVLNRLRDNGHIRRVVGAGTFLARRTPQMAADKTAIGLFVPGLGRGEIFEPICASIAELSPQHNVTLIWGGLPSSSIGSDEQLTQAAERLIEQGIRGVFFQPIEREQGSLESSRRIAKLFSDAGVKLVLLDADYESFPKRSANDLVEIDNTAASYQLAEHYLDQGAERVDFVWRPYTANTLQPRIRGYHEALIDAGIQPDKIWMHEGDTRDAGFVSDLVEKGAKNIICANDETASQLMSSLEALGLSVPGDVRVAGFDDVKYAHMLRVPLTTVRQPCRSLAEVALKTMIDRIEMPLLPPMVVTLQAELCIRQSSLLPK
ncbi:substrate-binding domain-containing protein [uncultured Cohaesibacter sp.]|uniref:substrate-binding domain-containing protein n=1 Tax=uncultured Cohaesibacter sp. TaxID=1002546 RepID=UPI0029C8CC3F|nr:substrate-binding domain-containing protein [uncultured Cohaesibacter sp.]